MLQWTMLHPKMTMDHLGYLPDIILEEDPRPVKEQLEDRYRHGGGWRPNNGFKLLANNTLAYPGDPPFKPLATAQLRDEMLLFYDHALLAVVQSDRSFAVTRVD